MPDEFNIWEKGGYVNNKFKFDSSVTSKCAINVQQKCDEEVFSLIHKILKILTILPISNASFERTFSTLIGTSSVLAEINNVWNSFGWPCKNDYNLAHIFNALQLTTAFMVNYKIKYLISVLKDRNIFITYYTWFHKCLVNY